MEFLNTYTSSNNNNDPVTSTVIDSGVATIPTDRPSTFTPSYPIVAIDYGVGSPLAERTQVFEAASYNVVIDPGMIVNAVDAVAFFEAVVELDGTITPEPITVDSVPVDPGPVDPGDVPVAPGLAVSG